MSDQCTDRSWRDIVLGRQMDQMSRVEQTTDYLSNKQQCTMHFSRDHFSLFIYLLVIFSNLIS